MFSYLLCFREIGTVNNFVKKSLQLFLQFFDLLITSSQALLKFSYSSSVLIRFFFVPSGKLTPTADNEVPSRGHFYCYVRTDHELCFYDSSGAKPEAYGLPTADKYNAIKTQTDKSLSFGMQVAL